MAGLIAIADALQLILDQVPPPNRELIPTNAALGRTLAEESSSDVNSPPHDKSLVDGFAVCAADFHGLPLAASSSIRLSVLEEVVAGQVPSQTVRPGTATKIMTGAPIPPGADAVVMVEQTQSLDDVHEVLIDADVTPGQHIMREGTVMRTGQAVLNVGQRIRAIEVGLLAEVGRTRVHVFGAPSVAVLPTGDELVSQDQQPGPGCIRNSNGPMLLGLVEESGAKAIDLGIGRDNLESLRSQIQTGLEHDVLVLSGGVSAGTMDLVPRVLQEQGVEQVFHKVNIKPGKPIWFGVKQNGNSRTLVFGLPGNPVSSLVCFHVFVTPVLRQLNGQSANLSSEFGQLAEAFQQRDNRPTYMPAQVDWACEHRLTNVLKWQGSSDLKCMTQANGLAFFPTPKQFAAGDIIHLLRI